MAAAAGPNIVEDGLILALDAANERSYSSGSNINDLVDDLTSAEFYNDAGFLIDNNIKCFSFDGANDFIRVTRSDLNGGSWAYNNVSVCVFIKPAIDAGTGDNNIMTVERAFEFRFNRSGTKGNCAFAANPWAWEEGGQIDLGVWQLFTFTQDGSIGRLYSNINEIYNETQNGNLGSGTGSYPWLTIGGRYSGSRSDMKGLIAWVGIYNRALSDAEIRQNLQALRSRFNI